MKEKSLRDINKYMFHVNKKTFKKEMVKESL